MTVYVNDYFTSQHDTTNVLYTSVADSRKSKMMITRIFNQLITNCSTLTSYIRKQVITNIFEKLFCHFHSYVEVIMCVMWEFWKFVPCEIYSHWLWVSTQHTEHTEHTDTHCVTVLSNLILCSYSCWYHLVQTLLIFLNFLHSYDWTKDKLQRQSAINIIYKTLGVSTKSVVK